MKIQFFKYQGTGNDFILVDNRKGEITLSVEQIKYLCSRRFGIGADGLMLLEKSNKANFAMKFFNPDGSSGMMCGNGGRCIVAFTKSLGACGESCLIDAPDGLHKARIVKDGVELQLRDVSNPLFFEDGVHLDTGASHFVCFVDDLETLDLEKEGRRLRNDKRFVSFNGCNVNFVKVDKSNHISVRTYERGVEAETYACGTGITAAAIATALKGNFEDGKHRIGVSALGGELSVSFNKSGEIFSEVSLMGGVEFVFEGKITVPDFDAVKIKNW